MSRLIVKNLPKKSTESKVRGVFSSYGTITDCSLKYTKEGVFRRFAYVGFCTENEAQSALQSLNHTYMDTSEIQIEIAKDFSQSSVQKGLPAKSEKKSKEAAKDKTKSRKEVFVVDKILGDLEEDEGFQEFLDIHKAGSSKASWKNDDDTVNSKLGKANERNSKATKPAADSYQFEDSDSSGDELPPSQDEEVNKELERETTGEGETTGAGSKLAKDKALSDLEYLKKRGGPTVQFSDDEAESQNAQLSADKPSKKRKKKKKKAVYVVKLKNLPFNVNKMMIQTFFQGLAIRAVDIPRGEKKSTVGVAYVHFRTESEMAAALRRHRGMMANNKISVAKALDKDELPGKSSTGKSFDKQPSWEVKSSLIDVEPIADSGRLFVRNLAYSCTETDLEELFSTFGTLAEVDLPIDSTTKKIKGFAHIMFMFPEHAVEACNKLDGTTYKGRMLHILPGRPSKDETRQYDEQGNYKLKKEKAQKSSAQSSHNWNSLFLGANAVANVMAAKYGLDKHQVLDAESSQSLGVRLALGETEIVNETRDFLLDNGVSLDSFSQASGPRSKTVILVKNLPNQTSAEDLQELFSPFGILGRVVLPPSGISALIEFQEGQEAKAAFTKLAYKRFRHVPLYLEWAPVGVFTSDSSSRKVAVDEDGVDAEAASADVSVAQVKESVKVEGGDDGSDSDADTTPREGCTLFVKNLNFETTSEALKQHFSDCGRVINATIATKRDPRNPGKALSMGYGFVQFKQPAMVQTALKELQHSKLDKHQLELKLSERTSTSTATTSRKKQDSSKKQASTKILVRNIPFQANRKEVTELFKVFGELKLVRLPKKVGGQHRGFAFVDFITKNDAKRAFSALCHSTHLYGRRLVLEWADSAEESVDNLRKKTAEGYGKERKKFKRGDMQSTLGEMEAAEEDD